MEFSQTDALDIIFDTFSDSRNVQNLRANPQIAIVIGLDDGKTIQYEGMATELAGKKREVAKNIHIKKLPRSAKFAVMPNILYLRVKPTWMRFTDANQEPWDIKEHAFVRK